MACPNYEADVRRLKDQYPEAWRNAHTGNAHTEDFVRIVASYLRELDPNVGLNGKRGNPNDISDDALNILDPIDGPGLTPEGKRCWVVDFIASAGSPSAAVYWNPFSNPQDSSGAHVAPGTTPPPQPGPVQPYPSESPDGGWWGQVFDVQVARRYAAVNRPYPDPNDQTSLRWASRCSYSIRDGMTKEAALAKHLKELEEALGI